MDPDDDLDGFDGLFDSIMRPEFVACTNSDFVMRLFMDAHAAYACAYACMGASLQRVGAGSSQAGQKTLRARFRHY